MATIPGIIYLIIGGGIAYISKYLKDLEFFFWIGILFIIIGTFKIIFWFIARKPRTKKEKKYPTPSLEPVKAQPGYDKYPKYCPKCNLLYSDYSNFCSKCGSKLHIRP